MNIQAFGEVLPRYENYCELDKQVKDKFGIPALRFNVTRGDNELAMRKDMAATAAEMLESAGAINVTTFDQADVPPGTANHEMAAAQCTVLFDGSTLHGWQVLGVAEFEIRDGALVGRSVDAQQNSFLRTVEEFDNFELTLQFKFDEGMFNSGIQFRSSVYQQETTVLYRARGNRLIERVVSEGSVYGYQVEIDPSERAWTGEIHDEAARGWLDTYEKEPVQQMVQADTWHQLRLRAEGDRIATWIDGVQVADLVDDERSGGFIGLQVHGITDPSEIGKEVHLRSIELCTL